jgi:uncharacterized membrane protein YoaK (UPF0700 family)
MTARRWDQRYALLIGLTATAGTLDALAFLYLGKVFSSFQSGNVLFLGLGAGTGNGALVVRAAAVLTAFAAATALGARLIGTRLDAGTGLGELEVLAVEGVLLAAFGAIWVGLGDPTGHPVAQVVLVAIGAAAMGTQAALSLALKVPNVLTVALTATLAYLAQRLTAGDDEHDLAVPSRPLLAFLLATYAASALLVALLPEWRTLALLPLLLLSLAITVDVTWNEPATAR